MQDRSSTIVVLLVEDSKTDATLIRHHLESCSSPSFDLHQEVTLADGIKRLDTLAADIIVLDLTLPDSQGLDTFRAVNAVTSGTPIVILSGLEDEWVALEAVRRGAQDFFQKREALSPSLGRLLQYAIERYHRQEAEREIESAGFVQSRLFPKQLPLIPGIDVAGRCDPANQVGGDYFDYFMANDRDLIVIIGDVSGHGLGPSLVMAETRAALRTAAATTEDVGQMVEQANELLYDEVQRWFVTLFLARIDTVTGTCCYASAGHPAELLRRDGLREVLESEDPPLGIEDDTIYQVHQTKLGLGDTLLLYTDGISERLSPSHEQFGEQRVTDLVNSCTTLTSAQSVDRLFDATHEFAGIHPPADDMTAIVVKVVPKLLASANPPPR